MKRHVERVVCGGAFALDPDIRGDRLRGAEQDQGLVEQVRAQVEPNAGAGLRLLPPRARSELRPEAVKVGFEQRDAAQHPFRQKVPQGHEVSHVPAVLIGRKHAPLHGAELDELCGFTERGGKRLVDDDVASREEALLRDRMVRGIRRGDDDQVDGPREQLLDAAHEFDIRVARVRRAVALHDRGQAEAVDRANHGCVKYPAGEAETDESDVEHDRIVGGQRRFGRR